MQGILDAHRDYVNSIALNCLTLCNLHAGQQALDACLSALLDLVVKIETMVGGVTHRSGGGGTGPRESSMSAWAVALDDENAWKQMEEDMHAFIAAKLQLQHVVENAVSVHGGPLGYLLLELQTQIT